MQSVSKFNVFVIYLFIVQFGFCVFALGQEKPNIVWLLSEDNSVHYLKMFDAHGIATPELDKLAESGIKFTNAFSNAPVCSAARSTLISGCYGPRIGTHFHRKSTIVPMPDDVNMFPTYLRQAGYYTTNKGKEDYNAIKTDEVWDESSRTAHWSNRNAGQPFFHQQNIGNTHESQLHFSEEQMAKHKTTTNPDDVFVLPVHPNTEIFRYTNAFYRDRMLTIDAGIRKIIEQLKEEELLESTFIFYFGDHGGVLPGSKGYLYETGLHVPLLVRIPENFKHLVDIERGATVDGFVSFVDFAPTVLNLAGITPPKGMDGKPFLGKNVSKTIVEKQDIAFGYADRFDEKYDLVRSVRKGNLKYIRNYQPFNPDGLHNNYRYKCLAYKEWRDLYRAGKLNDIQRHFFEVRDAEELYDLATDPYETKNLANDPAYTSEKTALHKDLTKWVKGMPDLSFYPESELKVAFENPAEFGTAHKSAIAKLVDIADLTLLSYDKAKRGITKALQSDDPIQRYWGLIVCSTFGDQAKEHVGMAEKLTTDDHVLVRVRAAEFLGLIHETDPTEIITSALYASTDPVEATLILNTIVLLSDKPNNYTFSIEHDKMSAKVVDYNLVKLRLNYLDDL